MRDPGLQKAIDAAGNLAALADLLKISSQAISQWDRIPAERLFQIARLTSVPVGELRPDLKIDELPTELLVPESRDAA